jgi:hypothetical protein
MKWIEICSEIDRLWYAYFTGRFLGQKIPNLFGSQKLSTGIIESRHVPYNKTAESISDFENSEDRAS